MDSRLESKPVITDVFWAVYKDHETGKEYFWYKKIAF